MQVLQGIKSFLQFVGDADTYCLVRLAVRNFFKHVEDGEHARKESRSSAVRL